MAKDPPGNPPREIPSQLYAERRRAHFGEGAVCATLSLPPTGSLVR